MRSLDYEVYMRGFVSTLSVSCSLVPSLHSDWGLVMRLLASYGASVVTCSVFPQKFL